MITNSREADFTTKQEADTGDNKKIFKASSSSSTPWSRLKDPRIVRVSRAFGGKDRHSKVCTVRGLRDRRVRLSVSTAIQLYDLQDRLGLNQPSKVIDWLLKAAKQEIDELPPLQLPPGTLTGQNHQAMFTSYGTGASKTNKDGLKMNNNIDWDDPLGLSRSNFWSLDATLRGKSKEIETNNEREILKQGVLEGHGTCISSNNFFPISNHTPVPAGLLNSVMPYNSFYCLDPSNFSLSHLGSHGLTAQTEDLHNFNVVPLPSALSLPSGSQFLVCPPGTAQPFFPSNVTATSVDFNPKQNNHFQMMSSSSQNPYSLAVPPLYSISHPIRPFHFSMASKLLPSQNSSGSQLNKDDHEYFRTK